LSALAGRAMPFLIFTSWWIGLAGRASEAVVQTLYVLPMDRQSPMRH
jgi:hypothetical protein